MIGTQNPLSTKKSNYIIGGLLLLFISAICAAFSMTGVDEFAIAKKELMLRRIGHELLLKAGDSASRVLPIKNVDENEYQISFEHAFAFQTYSLVDITKRLLGKDPLANEYVVNVREIGKTDVIYGFAISKDKKDDIIACVGRKQPKGKYIINIKFKPTSINTINKGYILGSIPFLAFVGFIFLSSAKPGKSLSCGENTGATSLGSVSFDAKNRSLLIGGKTITLTGTETRILCIFASSANEIVERSRLQKEIWEDDGVIVGRSLDMFISKLRRKLEFDPNVNIVVVRGKGFKLEINSDR